ncbi:MAG: glycosyltransferase family 39 protein [Acidobacteriota bacterium]
MPEDPSRNPAPRPDRPAAEARPAGAVDPALPVRLAGFGLFALSFAAMAAWSWRRWPDLLADFGQQLYVPWRLASGEVLYRDIAWLHGPLSQHLNAAWFALFGTSFTTLVVANLAILAVALVLVHRIVASSTDRLTAFTATAVFLLVFAFSQYVRTGNYNFVSPYTHEATHGVALAAAMIVSFDSYLRTGRRRWPAVSGLCCGLLLLTKLDVALAGVATALAAWGCALGDREERRRRLRRGLPLFAGAASVPALGFFLYFRSAMSPGDALRAAGGAVGSARARGARNIFYASALGVDRPGANLALMLEAAAWIAGFALSAAALDVAARRLRRDPYRTGLALGLPLLVLLWMRIGLVPWQELPRALPLLAAALTMGLVLQRRARRGEAPGTPDRGAALLLWTVFALALLSKIALNTHLFHYGFYMAMPAAVALVAALVSLLPRLVAGLGGYGTVSRILALSVLAAGVGVHLRWSRELYALKHLRVGRGGDAIVTYGASVSPVGTAVATALDWIEENVPSDATFVALPEGVMLNYLSRRRWPARCINYMMTEMIVFGEDELLDQLEAGRPDYILLVHKETREFGVGYFGSDPRYGERILEWVEREYEPLGLIGAEPLRDGRFGIKILRRRAPGGRPGEP